MKSIVVKFALVRLMVISLMLTGAADAKVDLKSLVGFWLFDQESGGMVKDHSGNGNDVTIESGKLTDDGNFGKALGSPRKINLPTTSRTQRSQRSKEREGK